MRQHRHILCGVSSHQMGNSLVDGKFCEETGFRFCHEDLFCNIGHEELGYNVNFYCCRWIQRFISYTQYTMNSRTKYARLFTYQEQQIQFRYSGRELTVNILKMFATFVWNLYALKFYANFILILINMHLKLKLL